MRLLKVAFFIGSLFLFVPLAHSNKWCHEKYDCLNPMSGRMCKHTMCQYKEKGPYGCHHWQHGLKEEEKAYLLHWHNEVRAKVARGEMEGQPRATNMLRMEWDDETEMIAQRWASQCTDQGGHDDCRHLSSKEDAGQNYAWKAGSGSYGSLPSRIPTLQGMFHGWIYDEVGNVVPQYIDRFPRNGMRLNIGHYTQAVWAESTRLGCGLAYLEENQGRMLSWEYRLICNYVVRGNFNGKPIYLQGNEPATECPENSKPSGTYRGLCEYPKKYHDFGKLLVDHSNENSKNPNPVQKPGYPNHKPSLNSKQTSRTSTKPAASKPQSNFKFNFDLGNVPFIGRFFTKTPTAQKNQAKPTSGTKPLEFGLVRRTQSQQEIESDGLGERTDVPASPIQFDIPTLIPRPTLDDVGSGRVDPPHFTKRPTLDDWLGERSEVSAPPIKFDIPTFIPRPTLDDVGSGRTRIPNYSALPPKKPTDGSGYNVPSYAMNPTEYKSPGVEVRQVTRSPYRDPYEEIKRNQEDFQRRVHDNFNKRFEEATGMSSSIFDPHTDFFASPPISAVSPYSRSSNLGRTSLFDGGFQTDDGFRQGSLRRKGFFQQ